MDLLEKSKDHISFLNGLHSLGVTLHRPSKKSLERYRDQWLPMVYKCNQKSCKKEQEKLRLIPPPDIAWLFHCHRLAPLHYANYCRKKFGINKTNNDRLLPDAEAPFSFQSETGEVHRGSKEESKRTQRRWEKCYPNEPFFLEPNGGNGAQEMNDHSPSLFLNGFDLLGSTMRQSSFLWHISSPHFSDEQFLKVGIDRYHKFILLRKTIVDSQQKPHEKDSPKHPSMIVPTYDIDLMWHTHILSGLVFYHNDCRKLLGGSTLNHDDGVGEDRSEGGTLDVAFRETTALWKHSYGEDYSIAGGMYKGEPPKHYYSKEWSSNEFTSAELLYAAAAGVQPFMHFVGIQGATSTNQVDHVKKDVIWCWKEIPSQMSKYDADQIMGDPKKCFIKYDSFTNDILEQAFQNGRNTGVCDIAYGYTVNFSTGKQTEASTGHEREVKRFIRKYIKKAAPVVAKATLIDNVSTNVDEPHATLVEAKPIQGWTLLTETAPDGLPAFQKAQDKSTTRGVITNTQKENYVFGKKGDDVGYFHITTKEAYEVLAERVKIMARKKETDIAFAQSCKCLYGDVGIKEREKQLEELNDVKLIATERAKTRGLGDKNVKVPKRLLHNKKHFADDGYIWYFPHSYYTAGGGCGYFTHGGGFGGGCGGGDGDCGACGGGDGGGACGGGKLVWIVENLCLA